MSFPTTSWLLWQNEHRRASSDPARFTQSPPQPPGRMAPKECASPHGLRGRRTGSIPLSPECGVLSNVPSGREKYWRVQGRAQLAVAGGTQRRVRGCATWIWQSPHMRQWDSVESGSTAKLEGFLGQIIALRGLRFRRGRGVGLGFWGGSGATPPFGAPLASGENWLRFVFSGFGVAGGVSGWPAPFRPRWPRLLPRQPRLRPPGAALVLHHMQVAEGAGELILQGSPRSG
jgi:hypothetical protein